MKQVFIVKIYNKGSKYSNYLSIVQFIKATTGMGNISYRCITGSYEAKNCE